ncbi:MAG: sialate O-acetylesterase, partial [Akkermansiaceae bacterium]|nr:sialate O-acetylesterase [Akkermansiaceae bacterium]
PYAVRGAIWYQGESNAGVDEDPRNYRHKMRALVEGWRRAWKQPAMPFYFVQLPGFRDDYDGWTRLREEQRLSLEIPHTGMAVTID